jgi:hypothetical protein
MDPLPPKVYRIVQLLSQAYLSVRDANRVFFIYPIFPIGVVPLFVDVKTMRARWPDPGEGQFRFGVWFPTLEQMWEYHLDSKSSREALVVLYEGDYHVLDRHEVDTSIVTSPEFLRELYVESCRQGGIAEDVIQKELKEMDRVDECLKARTCPSCGQKVQRTLDSSQAGPSLAPGWWIRYRCHCGYLMHRKEVVR